MARLALLAALLRAATASARPPASSYDKLKSIAAVERGDKLLDQNKLDEALEEFAAAIRLGPTSETFSSRDLVWIEKREWAKALADLDAALR